MDGAPEAAEHAAVRTQRSGLAAYGPVIAQVHGPGPAYEVVPWSGPSRGRAGGPSGR